jgi:hypothetical protein
MTARHRKRQPSKRWSKTKMIAGAGGVVALLVGFQQLGVFNHVDTPAWSSDVVRIQQQVQQLTRNQIQQLLSFYEYQLNQYNAALATNQAQQQQYGAKRLPTPPALIDQAAQLQNAMRDLQQRITENQRRLQP